MLLDYFKMISACIGAGVGYIYGGWSTPLILLCYFVFFDYLSGVMAAASCGALNSKKGFIGAGRKLMIFVFVAIAHLIDQMLGLGFIMQATIFYYLSGEFISIAENAAILGVPIPTVLRDAMANLPGKEKGGGNVGQ
jgi:toxin secretion/phage lysis holin